MSENREIITAASDGAHIGYPGMIGIKCHHSRDSPLNGNFKHNISIIYAVLRQSRLDVIDHNCNRSFAESFSRKVINTRKGINTCKSDFLFFTVFICNNNLARYIGIRCFFCIEVFNYQPSCKTYHNDCHNCNKNFQCFHCYHTFKNLGLLYYYI